MLCQEIEACSQSILLNGTTANRGNVHSVSEMIGLIDEIVDAMATHGHGQKEQFRTRLALEEAIVNAHKHGHQRDWSRPIGVRYHVSGDGVVLQVEDEGPGFDRAQVPDPCAEENLARPSGRGLLLMRSYMTNVCHNEQGNRVCLCKRRLASDMGS